MSKILFHSYVGLCLICCFSDLHAAVFTWNGQSSNSGPSDGSGTWNLSNGNKVWWNGSSRVAWANANNAVFGNTTLGSYTITLGANITAQSMSFNLSTYTIASSANTLTLSSGNVTVASGVNATINQAISGSGGFTKLGVGTLTLGGANAYSGATTISAGTLRLSLGTAIPDSSAVSANAGATFDLNNNNETIGSLSGAGTVNLGSGLLTTGGLNTSTTHSGVIGGAGGSLTKTGTGTLTLSGANTYTGGTTISAGTFALGASDRLADTGSVNVASGATFSLGGFNEIVGALSGAGNVSLGSGTLTAGDGSSTTFSGVISGTNGNFTKAASGTVTLSGANTYSGATTVSAGTLRLGIPGAISDSSAVTVNSGAIFDLNGNNETIGSLAGAGNVTLGVGNLTTGADNSSTTHSGVISGTGGLTKTGAGTFILSGNNTYTGPTTVNAGVLRVAGITSGSTFTVNNGATVSGSGTIADFILNGGGTVSPGVSPGTLNTGSQTWSGGAHYTWEINQASGTKGSDPGWDFLNINGTLTINATSGSKFNVHVNSLSLGGASGSAANFDNSQNYAWTIATASGGVVGFDPLEFNLDLSAFQNALGGGSFGISQSGNDVSLSFSAVPEPHEYALVAAIGLLGFALWRHRKS